MEFKKTTTEKYAVRPIGKIMGATLAKFLKIRRTYDMTTKEFETCFMCDTELDLEKEHNGISVVGHGNLLVCDACYQKVLDATIEIKDRKENPNESN